MSNFSYEIGSDNIAIIKWDVPDKKFNVLTLEGIGEIENILEKITNTCKNSDNLMPFVIAAAKEHATIGEIIKAMKNEFGEWQETVGF